MNNPEIAALLTRVEEFIMIRVSEIREYHEERTAADLTVEALDDLVVDTLELKSIVEQLGDIGTKINKAIMRHESRAGTYLEALGRDGYESPDGVIEKKADWHVNMPPTPEDKALLFGFLHDVGLFEQYATVNSKALNSLYMAEWSAAKKEDPTMEVLFSMPGVPSPTLNEFTKIKAPRGKRSKRKETEDEPS